MRHYQEYEIPFSIEQVYSLIIDIESYPEFLPWCQAARIVERNTKTITADLIIHFKYITEQYRSQVTLTPPNLGKAQVEAKMISGPFDYLNNSWELIQQGSHTLVKFHVDFCFKSIVLQKIVGIFFYSACEKMLTAFVERANKLYG
jgi:coenzyme Q-binding protein COQ10